MRNSYVEKAPLPHNKRICYPPYPDHYLIFSLLLDPQFYIFHPHSWIPSFSTILSFPHLLLILEFPPSQFDYFPSSSKIFIFSTLNLDFPPPPQFYHFPSSSSAFSFKLYIFPSTNTSTSYRPCIDPRLFFFFQHNFVDSETIYNHRHIYIVSIIHKAYLLWLFH